MYFFPVCPSNIGCKHQMTIQTKKHKGICCDVAVGVTVASWRLLYCVNPACHAIKRDTIVFCAMLYPWQKNTHGPSEQKRTLTAAQTQTASHLRRWGNKHGNHVVWSAPATATFIDLGGLRAIMSHFGEVKAPSTLTCSECVNYDSVKSRNYELGISFTSFESLVCPGTAPNPRQLLLDSSKWWKALKMKAQRC